jgi:hypothetical protein
MSRFAETCGAGGRGRTGAVDLGRRIHLAIGAGRPGPSRFGQAGVVVAIGRRPERRNRAAGAGLNAMLDRLADAYDVAEPVRRDDVAPAADAACSHRVLIETAWLTRGVSLGPIRIAGSDLETIRSSSHGAIARITDGRSQRSEGSTTPRG